MTAPPEPTVIVGSVDEVKAALLRADTDGRLVRVEDAVRLRGDRVRVTAELVPVAPQLSAAPQPPCPVRPRARWWPEDWVDPAGAAVAAVMVVAAVAAVGAVVWTIVVAVTALLTWLAAHATLIVGGAVGVGLLVALLGASAGRCPGLHCGGCRRR